MNCMILVLGREMNTMGSVTPSTASPNVKGTRKFPCLREGQGQSWSDDERVTEPPWGSLNGTLMEDKWIPIG